MFGLLESFKQGKWRKEIYENKKVRKTYKIFLLFDRLRKKMRK